MEATRKPLDIDALREGDVIPSQTIEDITGAERGTDAFRVGGLKLMGEIMRRRRDIGKPVVVRFTKHSLRVLTVSEWEEHDRNSVPALIRRVVGRAMRYQSVPVSRLPVDQQRQHEVHSKAFHLVITDLKSSFKTHTGKALWRQQERLPQPMRAEPKQLEVKRAS